MARPSRLTARPAARAASRATSRAAARSRSAAPVQTIGLRAAEVIERQRTQIRAKLASAVDGRDPEGVHDMRVATRRLRACLGLFAPWIDPEELARVVPAVRSVTRTLGRVRELDVLRLRLGVLARRAAPGRAIAIEALAGTLERRRRKARARMLARFAKVDLDRLDRRLRRLVGHLEASGRPAREASALADRAGAPPPARAPSPPETDHEDRHGDGAAAVRGGTPAQPSHIAQLARAPRLADPVPSATDSHAVGVTPAASAAHRSSTGHVAGPAHEGRPGAAEAPTEPPVEAPISALLRVAAPRILAAATDALDQPIPEQAGSAEAAAAIHRVRIAAKKLRYLLEVVAPYLDESASLLVKRLRSLQDRLGDFHDDTVLDGVLGEAIDEAVERERKLLAAELRRLRRSRRRALASDERGVRAAIVELRAGDFGGKLRSALVAAGVAERDLVERRLGDATDDPHG